MQGPLGSSVVTPEWAAVPWSPGRLQELRQSVYVIAKLFCLLRHLWMTGSVPTCLVLKRVTQWNRDGLTCCVLSQAGSGADAGSQGEKSGQGENASVGWRLVKPRGPLDVVECSFISSEGLWVSWGAYSQEHWPQSCGQITLWQKLGS